MDAAIDNASTSQGSQVTWCFRNLALKKLAVGQHATEDFVGTDKRPETFHG